MWDFDEKAFDQFIRKRFNLEKEDDLKKSEKEENIAHLNEAALSEAISESLNENATKEDVRREENRNIDTYTYDYPTISSINISPSKYSIFSDKPREQLKTDTTSKLSIKESTWSSGVLKENSVKTSETKIQLPNSNNMRSSSSNMLNNPAAVHLLAPVPHLELVHQSGLEMMMPGPIQHWRRAPMASWRAWGMRGCNNNLILSKIVQTWRQQSVMRDTSCSDSPEIGYESNVLRK